MEDIQITREKETLKKDLKINELVVYDRNLWHNLINVAAD